MQILITHGSLARTRVLRFNRWQLLAVLALLIVTLAGLSGLVYHFIFLKAAREGWPVVSPVMKLVVRDEFAQRDRFLRENLDAMAQKVGQMQAKLVKLEAMSERVSGLAGVKPDEVKQILKPAAAASAAAAQGGPYVPAGAVTLEQLNGMLDSLDVEADQRGDLFTMAESRLLESRLKALLIPNSAPVDGAVGSGFGFRLDPFSGHSALHTGLDFPADTGTPILAAAGGMVRLTEFHPAYGNMVEIDHGNGISTRYGHMSEVLVRVGDTVGRSDVIGLAGSTGRSTGTHLHYEVRQNGRAIDPVYFMNAGLKLATYIK